MVRKIKLAIADDHPLVVDGLSSYFKGVEEVELVTTTNKLSEVVSIVKLFSPDILLMDYHFSNELLTGLDVCRQLSVNFPCVKVIVVSSFLDIALIKDFIQAGAKGFMLKTSSRQEFIDAMMNVFAGGESFSKEVSEAIVKDKLNDSKQLQLRFTRTEKEILKLIIEGDSSNTIAKKLFRERTTIDSHRKSILAKFQLMDSDNPNPSKNISHYIAKFNVANRLDCM